jgi:PAS domain-containing protein
MAYRSRSADAHDLEFVSEGCLELTGYAPQHIIGNTLGSYQDLIHAEDRSRIREELQRAANGRIRSALSHCHRRWANALGQRSRSGGARRQRRNVDFDGIIHDITVQVEAEATLAARQQQLRLAVDVSEPRVVGLECRNRTRLPRPGGFGHPWALRR